MSEIHLEPARYASEGETLYCPVRFSDGSRWLVPARVAMACGYHARLVNEGRILDRWYHTDDLYRRVPEATQRSVSTVLKKDTI